MSAQTRMSQSRFSRLCGRISLWCSRTGLFRPGQATSADELDERLKRDAGFDSPARPDPRGEHYRRLLRRGYPLW
ncbi:hypothetical protein [Hoeflea sp.]|uniref:hypothetical protein n=1 Tax=Hoeflea sp. TaxID=1940281 RepID=UPI003A916117